ncbi:unnamed protein product, partial [Mycena citricolor]
RLQGVIVAERYPKWRPWFGCLLTKASDFRSQQGLIGQSITLK